MLHAREDYNRIQDPEGKIPEDEPVFLLRAQDEASVPALMAWIEHADEMGASKEIIHLAEEQLDRMIDWEPKKVPDL